MCTHKKTTAKGGDDFTSMGQQERFDVKQILKTCFATYKWQKYPKMKCDIHNLSPPLPPNRYLVITSERNNKHISI